MPSKRKCKKIGVHKILDIAEHPSHNNTKDELITTIHYLRTYLNKLRSANFKYLSHELGEDRL